MSDVKEEAKKMLDNLPEQVSLDDIMYEIYVRRKIDEGLKAAEEGKVVSHDEIKRISLKN